jgi:cytochrome c oxidase assembly factor CtaG
MKGRAHVACVLLALSTPAFAHSVDHDVRTNIEAWLAGLLLIAGLLYLTGLYRLGRSAGTHRAGVRRAACVFAIGWITLAAALVSPLSSASEGVFSAHMIQHELLMVIAAPLMVLGRPLAIWTWALPPAWRRAAAMPFRQGGVASAWRFISAPAAAFMLHAAAIWIWHAPALFERAEASVALHALQHSAFLFTALLFWWSLLKPARQGVVGAAVLCLFLTMLHTGALGVLLTFSSDVWYPASTSGAHHWGLTPLEDQQLGGLIMWVPGGLPYVIAALALAARWFRSDRTGPRTGLHAIPH